MVVGLNPNRPIRYILKTDRDSEKPTVWFLKVLKPDVYAELVDETGSLKGMHRTFLKTLRAGLDGWEDFHVEGDDGSPVLAAFEKDTKGVPTDACLQMIPPVFRAELASAILAAGRIDNDEKKGSS